MYHPSYLFYYFPIKFKIKYLLKVKVQVLYFFLFFLIYDKCEILKLGIQHYLLGRSCPFMKVFVEIKKKVKLSK